MSLDICPSWLSFILENGIRSKFHNPAIMLGEYIKPGNTVIDIGCGPGYFSIPMATMAGRKGKVISVDIQKKMLEKLIKNAERYHVEESIQTINCTSSDLCINEKADFILTFWMVHEVVDVENFIKQIFNIMKPGSYYLLSEPKIHVSKKKYAEILRIAESAGFKKHKEVKIWGSRSMVFTV